MLRLLPTGICTTSEEEFRFPTPTLVCPLISYLADLSERVCGIGSIDFCQTQAVYCRISCLTYMSTERGGKRQKQLK